MNEKLKESLDRTRYTVSRLEDLTNQLKKLRLAYKQLSDYNRTLANATYIDRSDITRQDIFRLCLRLAPKTAKELQFKIDQFNVHQLQMLVRNLINRCLNQINYLRHTMVGLLKEIDNLVQKKVLPHVEEAGLDIEFLEFVSAVDYSYINAVTGDLLTGENKRQLGYRDNLSYNPIGAKYEEPFLELLREFSYECIRTAQRTLRSISQDTVFETPNYNDLEEKSEKLLSLLERLKALMAREKDIVYVQTALNHLKSADSNLKTTLKSLRDLINRMFMEYPYDYFTAAKEKCVRDLKTVERQRKHLGMLTEEVNRPENKHDQFLKQDHYNVKKKLAELEAKVGRSLAGIVLRFIKTTPQNQTTLAKMQFVGDMNDLEARLGQHVFKRLDTDMGAIWSKSRYYAQTIYYQPEQAGA